MKGIALVMALFFSVCFAGPAWATYPLPPITNSWNAAPPAKENAADKAAFNHIVIMTSVATAQTLTAEKIYEPVAILKESELLIK